MVRFYGYLLYNYSLTQTMVFNQFQIEEYESVIAQLKLAHEEEIRQLSEELADTEAEYEQRIKDLEDSHEQEVKQYQDNIQRLREGEL